MVESQDRVEFSGKNWERAIFEMTSGRAGEERIRELLFYAWLCGAGDMRKAAETEGVFEMVYPDRLKDGLIVPATGEPAPGVPAPAAVATGRPVAGKPEAGKSSFKRSSR